MAVVGGEKGCDVFGPILAVGVHDHDPVYVGKTTGLDQTGRDGPLVAEIARQLDQLDPSHGSRPGHRIGESGGRGRRIGTVVHHQHHKTTSSEGGKHVEFANETFGLSPVVQHWDHYCDRVGLRSAHASSLLMALSYS